MAGLNVRFTEDEAVAVRECADAAGVSMQEYVHEAVVTAIDERSRSFDAAADHVLRVSAELNRRLA